MNRLSSIERDILIADLAYDTACDLAAVAKTHLTPEGALATHYLEEAARLAFAAGVLRQAAYDRPSEPEPDDMHERIANRTLELIQKKRRTRAEETELAILTYDGPRARVLPPSDEVAF